MNTCIIKLWAKGGSKADHPVILGPFTRHDAQRVIKHLTCPYEFQLISTKIPKWATA